MINSAKRLSALESYAILDTPAEAGFDDIVLLATQICQTPAALVSFVAADRQWFKAKIGFASCQTPLSQSVCAHALEQGGLLVIPDLSADPRTMHNPLVTGPPHLRFYAGAVLETPEGDPLGTLCVLDGEPRPAGLTGAQEAGLLALSRQVMSQLALRRAARTERAALDLARTNEALLRFALRAGRLGFWTRDLASGVIEASVLCKRHFGRDASEPFTHAELCAAIHQDDRERMAAAVRHTIETGADYDIEYRVLRPDGSEGWVMIRAQIECGLDGSRRRLAGISLDITQQKLDAARLALSEERLSSALGASGMVGVWDWDLRTGLIYADPNLARIHDVEPAWAAKGAPMAEYTRNFHPTDLEAFQAKLDALFAGDGEFSAEYRISVADGGVRWVHARGRLIRDEAGSPIRFSGASVDISERKQAEEQKHLLMEEMSHRVKNTLSIVQAIASQTLRGHSDAEAVRSFEQRILALSRAHDALLQKDWEAASVLDVLNEVLGLQAVGDRFDLAGPGIVLASRAALSLGLLVHELATNAVKYGALSNATGRVGVAWGIEQAGEVELFVLRWHELGGPPASKPARGGFGSRLIGMGLAGTRNVALRYGASGLAAEFKAPLSLIVEKCDRPQ